MEKPATTTTGKGPLMDTHWANKAQAYHRSFASVCAGTVPTILSLLQPGVVADIGCGTGTLALAAAHAGYAVRACDAEKEMVDFAAGLLQGTSASVVVDTLPELALFADHSVTNAVTNFVINHVPDPRAHLASVGRIVRPGGRILTSVWTSDFLPHRDLIAQTMARYTMPEASASTPLPKHLDFERSPEGLAAINTEAGYTVLDAQLLHWQWRISWDDYWCGVEAGIGGVGAAYLSHPSPIRERIRQDMSEVLTPYRATEDTLVFPCQAALVHATT